MRIYMMKKIFCVLFILCVAVCCGYSWGLLPSMVEGNILIFKLVKQSSPVLTTCVREKQEVRDKKNGGWTYEYQNIKDRDIHILPMSLKYLLHINIIYVYK